MSGYGAGTIRSLGGKVRRPRPLPRPGQKRQNQVGDITGQDPEQVLSYLQSLQPPDPAELPAAPEPRALTAGDPAGADAPAGGPPPLTLTPNGA